MNAIQKFAEEHGTDDSESLEQAFKSAVQSVIGNKGKVIDAWNDGGSEGYCDWHCSVKGVDGMAPNTEFMLTLTTNEQNGRSWLACQYDNDDCDILGDAEGIVGEFDPLPLFNKCLGKSESKKSEAAEVKDKKYYQDMFDAAYKECCQLAIDDGKSEEDWADYFSDIKNDGPFKQKEADEIVGYYMEFHPESDSEPDRPYRDWLENIEGIKHTPLDNEITRILKALYAPNESKKHVCSMQKKKESLLAKKNESVSLPQDVKDAMKKVQAFLQDNYTAIEDSGLVSDEDCSVGYQLDCTLNVLGDVVANFPKG